MGSILLLLRPWMGYNYIVIQIVCWVELSEQKRLCPISVKIWIPINGTQQCDIGSPEIHKNYTVQFYIQSTNIYKNEFTRIYMCKK